MEKGRGDLRGVGVVSMVAVFCLWVGADCKEPKFPGKLLNTATECNETSGMIGIHSEGAEIEVRKIYVEPLKR